MTRAKRSKRWSYSAGERGTNRVRAFDKNGKLFVEYYDTLPGQNTAVRKRIAIRGTDREVAKAKAEELAMAFRREERLCDGHLTLGTLFDMYEREVSLHKGVETRRHDRAAFGLFRRAFGTGREVRTLNRRDLDRFVQLRLTGELAVPKRPPRRKCRTSQPDLSAVRAVRPRTVQYDLKTLMAVLNWATVVRDERGPVLLERNPLKGLPLPVEANPRRAVFTDEQFDVLCAIAPTIHPLFGLAVITAYHTGHRIGAIRHLRWNDIDVETNRITWRSTYDKCKREHVTPLATDLKVILQAERRKRLAIGDGWIFPNPKDAETPVPKYVMGDWMTRGLKRIGITEGERYGYHSIRHQFATSMKTLPLADLCALGGWKDSQTVIKCYMQPDEETMRAALENRRPVRTAASQ